MNKMKKTLLIFNLLFTGFQYPLNSVITLFLQKYPTFKTSLDENQITNYSKKLQQPGYLYKKIVKGARIETGVHGIMGMYLGFVSLSDHNGQLTFPRKQQKSSINFLVTKSIKPVYMVAPDTIHNWMLNSHEKSQMYNITLNHDTSTDLYYVETKKIDLPADNMISLDTIIIIASPKNVFIPEGATVVYDTPNLILPNIYIRKNFNFTYNALYTLSIKQYFEQINQEYKHEDQSIAMIIK